MLLKTVVAAVVLAMIAVTIVGNALVCLAVVLVRKLKQPANFLIVSLAIADFLVGLLVMPLALVDLLFSEWPLGRFALQCFFDTVFTPTISIVVR